ncbi:hypothetical protein KAR91_08060 [Candidatus Pacearchaeota archaeon]|nr:hypothetical protein [Candidatus Pacearchaeota archaeon]
MAKFSVGDIVIVVNDGAIAPCFHSLIGNEVEIVPTTPVDIGFPDFDYVIDVRHAGITSPYSGCRLEFLACTETQLKKRPPHSEPSTWENCVFKPNEVTA